MKIGYARVSTEEQNLDMQVEALKRHGCEQIFEDNASGSDSGRNGLRDAIVAAKSGDIIVVWKLDRLSRSLKHILEIFEYLEEAKVNLVSIMDAIDTTSAMGRAMFQIAGVFAELERGMIIERTNAGLRSARARGVKLGRRNTYSGETRQKVRELSAAGKSSRKIAAELAPFVDGGEHHVHHRGLGGRRESADHALHRRAQHGRRFLRERLDVLRGVDVPVMRNTAHTSPATISEG